MSLREEATPLVGQLGGRSTHKRPVLSLATEYVLKPLTVDHRGIREVAFYEALEVAQNRGNQAYAQFLAGKDEPKNAFRKSWEMVDTVALALAMLLNDSSVQKSEEDLREAWKAVKKEVDALHRLNKFVPRYYGVIGQRGVSASMDAAYGITEDAYLLIQGLTLTYSKPCVMDLKMGTQTYEPDAGDEKIRRESGKYTMQKVFGFRIIGLRLYDPFHKDADEKGFRLFGKQFGRSLHERDDVVGALRMFFSSGCKPLSENGGSRTGNQLEQVRIRALSDVLLQLRALRRWFDDNKSLQFRASSLLIIYEGDPDRGNGDVTLVKMIDFGHVRRAAGGDSGYIAGVRSLQHMLTDILEADQKDSVR